MKVKFLIGTSIIASSNASLAITTIAVKDLHHAGIDQSLVVKRFMDRGLKLNINEILSVSADHEGKNLKIETLDKVSIIVDASRASGIGNKDRTQ